MEQKNLQTPFILRNYIRWPLAVMMVLVVLLGLFFIFIVDPSKTPGLTIPCFTYMYTGLYCPGCGNTRALHALTHGHILEAMDFNILFPFIVIVAAYYYLVGLTTLVCRRRVMWIPQSIPLPASISIGVVIVLFTVLRNIPVWPFSILAP